MKKFLSPILTGLLVLGSLSGCATPEFTISSLEVIPQEPVAGESISVEAMVSNTGGADGIYTATLTLDGATIESIGIEVAAESLKTVSFKCPIGAPGEHVLELGNATMRITVLEPARFEVTSLSVIPREPVVGESVTVNAEVQNTGGADGIYTATLFLDRATVESLDIEVAAKSSKRVTFKCPIEAPGKHTFNLGDMTTHVTALAPARFEVTTINITPAEVLPDKTVTAEAEIRNDGDVEGEYKAVLLVNDSVETTRDVTLAAGTSEWLTFNFSRSTPGLYQVSLGHMGTDFKVLKPADIEVYSLDINPNPVPVGDEAQAEVNLRNNGESKGVYTLSISVNDDVIGTREIELMGGEKSTIPFSFNLDEPGSYDIKVDNLTETLRVIDLMRPATGTYITGRKGSDSYGELRVDNGLGVDSLVVLTSRSAPETPVAAVYIRAEDSCRIWPGRGTDAGYFYIYFACGMDWDNYAKEFTTERTFEKFEEIFNFKTYEYTITLHAVAGGTASTEGLDEDEFPSIK